ncbi:RHTO0S06e03642g2_1 [Rhodotorula toruloides]|uniref:RHTO0S06e03642g2_1 n=1 Tax=Rhodotorula toruloides TaxID=5286 RepID=A0A061AWP7_RHOTO|nr:RHTO0S06e03642g2_1 [Rhodotorula toruloides]
MPRPSTRDAGGPSAGLSHGLVPPHLAQQLTRFVYENDPLHVPGLAPRWSLELELIWRTVPPDFWLNKAKEEATVLKQLSAVKTKLKQLEGARGSHVLENTRRELADRWHAIKMGYSVVFHARYDFFLWLTTRDICCEYAYQALEEFAEGTDGSLSMYWPETARRTCSEGKLLPAD